MFLMASPVSAATATPPPSSITVQQGDVFLLRGSVTFNVADTQGYFFYGPVYWYNYGNENENFIVENENVYWTSGGTGVGKYVDNLAIIDYAVPNGWQVDIADDGNGIGVDGTFNVDIWLRARGSDGTPHAPGHQYIYFAANSITFFEPNPGSVTAGPIDVNVTAVPRGVTVSINPSSENGWTGDNLVENVVITNTGLIPENFRLTLSDNSGWPKGWNAPSQVLDPTVVVENIRVPTDFSPENKPENAQIAILDDGYTIESVPTRGQGRSYNLYVQVLPTAGNREYTYIKFDLSSIPAGADITGAKLWLCSGYGPEASNYAVEWAYVALYSVTDDSWKEGENRPAYDRENNYTPDDSIDNLKWNNQPAMVNMLDNELLPAPSGAKDNYWYTWSGSALTTFIADEHAGDGLVSLGLQASTSQYPDNLSMWFYGKDNYYVYLQDNGSPSNRIPYDFRPALEVTYTNVPIENTISLGPGENWTGQITKIVSGSPGGSDIITVDAKSWDSVIENTATCNVHATVVRGVSVSISPKYQENLVGGTLNYTVTVTNTGNVDDNYILTVGDNENWSPSIVSSIAVPAFENGTATLSVTISSEAIVCTVDNIIVTATSQFDPSVKASDNCSAHAQSVIDKAIDDGVAWLVAQQNPDGSWGSYYTVACTGLAVLKLEEHSVDAKYGYGLLSPFDLGNPYLENMENGLNYIFLNANVIDISVQPAGNPDTNGDNKGVYFGGEETYETAIAIMAIAASRSPDRVVHVLGSEVDNWTYENVVQDAVDYLAFGQTDNYAGVYRGGWYYEANEYYSDQSNSGWATFGLGFAESPTYGFMSTIPAFVKTEENYWVNYIQSHDNENYPDYYGGAGYEGPNSWVNILKTGHLLYQMEFLGDTAATPRVQDAVDYLVRHWNDNDVDPGWRGAPDGVAGYQAMNNVMKGLFTLGIRVIGGIDWQTEFENVLLAQQLDDGSWPNSYWDEDVNNILSTEWALLCLEMIVPPFRMVEVTISPDNQSGSRGSTLAYTVTIRNIGNVNDNYNLTVSDSAGWGAWLSVNVFNNVQPGENRTTTLRVTVPSAGTSTTITVTARSVDPSVSGSAYCTAIAGGPPVPPVPPAAPKVGVSVSISPSTSSALIGESIHYTVTVMNTGDATDTFDLSISGGTGWSPSISINSITLGAGTSSTATLTVTVPSWATAGISVTIMVTATSRADPTVSSSASCKATASAPAPGPGPTPTPTGMSGANMLVISGALLAIILLSLFLILGAYRRRRKKKSSST
jgi:hypothetical protein